MEFTEIKSGLFGYSKKSVCRYISELNEIKGSELAAQKASSEKAVAEYEEKLQSLDTIKAELETRNTELTQKVSDFENELTSLKASYAELEALNASLNEKYVALCEETEDLRNKSDVISTAIINAEKCATTMINDADVRAKEMIGEAEEKVEGEVRRLDTAKMYISEVREAVEIALKKIDAELGNIQGDIDAKKTSVYTDEKKSGVKEKFEMFFKKA